MRNPLIYIKYPASQRPFGSIRWQSGGKSTLQRVQPIAASVEDRVLAHVMRTQYRGNVVGWITLAGTLIFLRATFAEVVATPLLDGWVAAMGCVMLVWLVGLVRFIAHPPSDAAVAAYWMPFTLGLTVAVDIGIMASIWILLPAAPPTLQLFMVSLYAWFVVLHLFAGGGSDRRNGFAVAALLGSLILFSLTHDMPYGRAIAIFLILFGVTILALHRLISATIVSTVQARAAAEHAIAETEKALATVAAERDAKTRFIASASHDLQQPIQAASLFLEHALAAADLPTRDRATTGARSAFASVQALLTSMLDHLRLEAGAVVAKRQLVRVNEVLLAVCHEHEASASAAGMRIRRVTSGLHVLADATLLKRVLGNLVANAVRHAKGERILIGARLGGGRVEIWVIDDGDGIDGGESGRLFEDYAQGDHGTDNRGGFGIGLSSARRMAEVMDGTLDLDRRWVRGSAFRVRLSAVPPPYDAVLPVEMVAPCKAA